MLVSMTGFGRSKKETDSFTCTVEMKSVNHRYFDCHIKLPQPFMKLEEKIKKKIKKHIQRGRIDCFISIEGTNNLKRQLHIDWKLIDEYYQYITTLKERYHIHNDIELSHFLNQSDLIMIEQIEEENKELEMLIVEAVEEAVKQLKDMRIIEGNELQKDISLFLSSLEGEIKEAMQFIPRVQKEYEEKIYKKINELASDTLIDESRIVTEVALLSERSDITEELDRLKSHTSQFYASLQKEEPIGRKLDFLLQEMNREVNTIGSKSNDVQLSSKVVEMKSLLEKLREQVQNIE